jgi:hypothetical protein
VVFFPLGWVLLAGCACEPLLAKVLSTCTMGNLLSLTSNAQQCPVILHHGHVACNHTPPTRGIHQLYSQLTIFINNLNNSQLFILHVLNLLRTPNHNFEEKNEKFSKISAHFSRSFPSESDAQLYKF